VEWPSSSPETAAVHCAGLVLSGPCGVRDHGQLLAAELRRSGASVTEEWPVNDGHRLGAAWRASVALVRSTRGLGSGSTVIWHYSAFGYGFRGVPLVGVVFGLLARLRGARVVTVLHEPALPWARRVDRAAVVSLTQWLAVRVVVAGSTVVVVTSERRRRGLPAR
jgi:hypothetical protein